MSPTNTGAALAAALSREIPGLEVVGDEAAIAAKSRDYWMRSLLESRLNGPPCAAVLLACRTAAPCSSATTE